jgi:solute carrier family 5 (sodium-coupled monocarboxylate transporter), member 8/12
MLSTTCWEEKIFRFFPVRKLYDDTWGQKLYLFVTVAMSLVATFVSGITLLGTSTEIYIYGTQYCYVLAGPAAMAVFMHFVIIPVFYELKVVSMFEVSTRRGMFVMMTQIADIALSQYLERRFDMKMRLFGSVISSLSTITWLPIVIYVPALAFNQTTGIDVFTITPVVMTVCVFYTCLGGIKAVIWTDVIQIVIMYGVMVLIIVKGTANVGGLGVVIERNWNSGRFEAPE